MRQDNLRDFPILLVVLISLVLHATGISLVTTRMFESVEQPLRPESHTHYKPTPIDSNKHKLTTLWQTRGTQRHQVILGFD